MPPTPIPANSFWPQLDKHRCLVHSAPLSREIGNGFRKASFSLDLSRTVTSKVRSGGSYFSMWMESRESLQGGKRGGEEEEGEGKEKGEEEEEEEESCGGWGGRGTRYGRGSSDKRP